MTTIGTYKGIPINAGTDAEVAAQMAKINAGGNAPTGGSNLPPGGTPPGNAGNVTQTPAVNLPTTNPTTPATNGIGGLLDYYKSMFETYDKQAADAKAAKEAAVTTQTTETKPFLDRLLGAKTPDQVRTDATNTTGVNPTEYFATEKASLAELGTLNTEYNDAVAAKDAAIAATQDKLGSNNFINNQVAQIERNAAPRINQLAANIKSKAAILEATQGRFNEAQSYIKEAVAAATADAKYNFDLYNSLYDKNQDSIDKLDTKYQTALTNSRTAAKDAWTTAVAEKTSIGELMIANPQAGITLNDTLEQAQAKVAGRPKATKPDIFGSAETGYFQSVYDPVSNTYKNVRVTGGTGGPNGSGASSNFLDVIQASIDAGATPEQAGREAATASENSGIPVNQATLASYIAQARKLKKTPAPVAPVAPTKNAVSVLNSGQELKAANPNNRKATVSSSIYDFLFK